MMNLISDNTSIPEVHLVFTVLGLKKGIIKVNQDEYADYYFECLDINRFLPKLLEFFSLRVDEIINFIRAKSTMQQGQSETLTAE